MGVLTYRNGGPAFVLNVAWLFATAPIFFGLIEYSYLQAATDRYLWIIFLAIGSYLTAAALARLMHASVGRQRRDPNSLTLEFLAWRGSAHFVLLLAVISISLVTSGLILNGIDISNLASVREQTVTIERAGLVERLAAVTTWACFFCVLFGFHFRHILSPAKTAIFIACGLGAILASLTSAGRQSILQLIMLLYFVQSFGDKGRVTRRKSEVVIRAFAIVFGISLLIYITLNRASSAFQSDRAAILLSIFGARLDFNLDSWLASIGADFREFMIETILYISHTVPLFSITTEIEFGQKFYGVFSFPFLYRQLEPILGINVIDSLLLKGLYINTANVIGAGWDTGLSSPMLDFGVPGLAVFMAVQGYFGQWAWMRSKATGQFGAILLSVLMMTAAAYTPFLPLFSDTSMFFLLFAGIGLYWFANSRGNRERSGATAFRLKVAAR